MYYVFMSALLKDRRGFTLIELLIVIVIISLLAALLMANFVGIRQRGRDAQRKSDLRQIQAALELYRSDNAAYPTTGFPPPCQTSFSSLAVIYIKKAPCDPQGATWYNSGSYYYLSTDATNYTLAACIENTNDNDPASTTTNPGGTGCATGKYFVLQNP